MAYPRISSLKTIEAFRRRLGEIGAEMPVDEAVRTGPNSPLGQPCQWSGGTIGNRFAVLPMEGWDGQPNGLPTELTSRRWRNFGLSGAKLIWGGEAVAVRHDGRANPHQLMLNDSTAAAIESLRRLLELTHAERFGTTDDLLVGLQLTHSGRFARPDHDGALQPRIAYRHPLLDTKFGVTDDSALLSDAELDRLVDDFVAAAVLAEKIGFRFVDVKQCHGYLGHEFLSGWDRPGQYGGDFTGRTRFIRRVIEGIQSETKQLKIGSRISIFDFIPFHPGEDGVGRPSPLEDYRYAFGGDGTGQGIDLTEPGQLLSLLEQLGVDLVCTTAGSPYYNPHIQRPALFPPSDGYQPPEDPLVGVARQIHATGQLKRQHPAIVFVGSGYTYLQDWVAQVGQAAVAQGMVDFIGLGRMVLSYPDLPADVLAGKPLARKKVCRTFSECTTGPRNGMISGCFPLDPFYKAMPERQRIIELKKLAK